MVKAKPTTPELAEEYFPERNAMANHLLKLNELISQQKHDAKLRHHLAISTTSNDSYGGFYHTPRKEKSQRGYFDPWFRHSSEYGKYAAPLPKPEPPRDIEIAIKKKQAEQEKRGAERHKKRIPAVPEFAHPLKIPPIAAVVPSGALSDRTDEAAAAKRQSFPHTNLLQRQELRTGPVNNIVTQSMGRLWENMHIPISKHGGSLTSLVQNNGPRRLIVSRLVRGMERKRGGTAYSHSIPSSRSSSP